jgi:UDP-MurNAc hydroxylase
MTKMKITFVGHASALLEESGLGLLMDPWLKGEAFNDSWTLYPQSELSPEDLTRVTHIWISHEHPDHLSIPTIKSMPAELKSKIVMLFQKHYDTEIRDWLRAQGFQEVREMPHAKWVDLSPGFQVACYQVGHMDSALAIKSQKHTILNLNDCETPIPTLKRLKRQLGHVDLLLDQFSIAGWPGNPQDVELRRARARHVLDNFIRDIQQIDPDYVLPFASFVRFSHKENAYINSIVNTLDDVAANVDGDKLLVMYPGDAWELGGDPFNGTAAAMDKYRRGWGVVGEQQLRSHETYEMKRIIDAANERIDEFQSNYQRFILRRVPPVTFYVTDLGSAFRVNLSSRAEEVKIPEKDCVVSLSSQAAWYTFAMRFGLPSLGVSGRFTINHSERDFARLKKLGSAYSSGFYTKKLPRFGVKPRLFEFWWRRRHDIFSQFFRRLW